MLPGDERQRARHDVDTHLCRRVTGARRVRSCRQYAQRAGLLVARDASDVVQRIPAGAGRLRLAVPPQCSSRPPADRRPLLVRARHAARPRQPKPVLLRPTAVPQRPVRRLLHLSDPGVHHRARSGRLLPGRVQAALHCGASARHLCRRVRRHRRLHFSVPRHHDRPLSRLQRLRHRQTARGGYCYTLSRHSTYLT